MARNAAVHKPLESTSTLNRLPHLADSLLHFNLSDELRRLREEDSWTRGSGRSSKTLAKYPDFRIVLVLMKPGSEMNMTEMARSSREWNGETDLIDGEMVTQHVRTLQGPIYYVAGPPPMVAAMREMLVVAGVDEDDVRTEEFAGY